MPKTFASSIPPLELPATAVLALIVARIGDVLEKVVDIGTCLTSYRWDPNLKTHRMVESWSLLLDDPTLEARLASLLVSRTELENAYSRTPFAVYGRNLNESRETYRPLSRPARIHSRDCIRAHRN